MRKLILLLAAVLILVPVVAGAAAPKVGTYKSTGGTILVGRATESNPADGAQGVVGNMITAESWNGALLGTEWKVTCGQIDAAGPQLKHDYRIGGTGQVVYETNYTGGLLWLSGGGLWGNGDAQYTSSLSTYLVTAYQQWVGGNLTGVVSNIAVAGKIDNYDDCFDLAISNAVFVGITPLIMADYPPFMGPLVCSLVGVHGTYWDADGITLNLIGACVVPTQSSTWGAIKTLYR